MTDTLTVLDAVAAHDRFSQDADKTPKNVMNGIEANSNVNVDTARSVGEKILSSMKMKTAIEYTVTRNAQGVTTASKLSIKTGSEHVQVDPQLLFQQMIIACDDTQLEELFQYDLCFYPTTLFYISLTLSQSQQLMWSRLTQEAKSQPQGVVRYALDGVVLLHREPLPICSLM